MATYIYQGTKRTFSIHAIRAGFRNCLEDRLGSKNSGSKYSEKKKLYTEINIQCENISVKRTKQFS